VYNDVSVGIFVQPCVADDVIILGLYSECAECDGEQRSLIGLCDS